MGKQYNKVEKRQRRRSYLKRRGLARRQKSAEEAEPKESEAPAVTG